MPRAKGEHSLRTMHADFEKTYSTVPFPLFRAVCEEFNKRMASAVLHDAARVVLPFRLGQLYVEKRKVNYNHLKMDYGHYRKTGEKLLYTNRHSDGFQAYYHWKKEFSNITHKSLYKFTPTRSNSRALAVVMKTPGGHKAYEEYIIPRLR